jgi:hypothetical protein
MLNTTDQWLEPELDDVFGPTHQMKYNDLYPF